MLIKWGSIVVNGSGKLGGHVFSKGAGGSSLHTLGRAKNPQTKYQMSIRSRFTSLSQGWRSLTRIERETWYSAESEFSRNNRFGDVILLSGKNLYNSLNYQRLVIGLGILNSAPLPSRIPKCVVKYVNFLMLPRTLFIQGEFDDGETYVIVATPSMSRGVRSYFDEVRIIGTGIAIGGGSQIGLNSTNWTKYEARFGPVQRDTGIYVGAYAVSESGQKGTESLFFARFNGQ